MSFAFDREFVAQLVITLAVCVGSWMVIVEPKARELSELEESIASARTSAEPGQQSLTTLAGRVESFGARVRSIELQNAFARDSSRMYGRIMDLAATHDVTIQRLDPGSRDGKDEGQPIRTSTFDMTVEGAYEDLALFLDAVVEMEGFVRPRTLTMAPRAQDRRLVVEARFVCDAISFELPSALAAMKGGGDVVE